MSLVGNEALPVIRGNETYLAQEDCGYTENTGETLNQIRGKELLLEKMGRGYDRPKRGRQP